MKIVVLAAKVDFGSRLDACVARATARYPAHDVTGADAIQWDSVCDTVAGSYQWCAAYFDGAVVLETACGGLGRGTFQIVGEFLRRGKPVRVDRDGDVLHVTGVRLRSKDGPELREEYMRRMKEEWGYVVTETRSGQVEPSARHVP